MDINNQVSHDDPQFVKVLETCLNMEIATANEKLEANLTKIKKMKTIIRTEIDRRKQLKKKVADMQKIKMILREALTSLHTSIGETTYAIEVMKASGDDQFTLLQVRSQEYQRMVADYQETWHAYHAMYNEFPLAKVRNVAEINLRTLQIEHMVATYKKAEMTTIIEQRRRIDWMRACSKIIEFATIVVGHSKLREKLMKLKVNVDRSRRELQSIEVEMQAQRQWKEDQKKLREQKMLELVSSKINIPYRRIYAENKTHTRIQHHWKQVYDPFDDAISVNTVALEELCINENTTMAPEEIDMESVQNNNAKHAAIQTEAPNLENLIVPEKTDTRAAPIAPDIETNIEFATSADINIEMKESHREEAQKSQESAKTQVNCDTKENCFKHKTTENVEDEIEAKRIRLQREDSKKDGDTIIVPQSSAVAENDANLKCPLSVPKIRKIETVHYNIVPIVPAPKPAHASSFANSMFSPMHYDFCDSDVSGFDQDFVSKGPTSLYEGSLCNYKLSPNTSISPMCVDDTAQMTFPIDANHQSTRQMQKDNKNQPDDNVPAFQFDNFMKRTKGNFSLF